MNNHAGSTLTRTFSHINLGSRLVVSATRDHVNGAQEFNAVLKCTSVGHDSKISKKSHLTSVTRYHNTHEKKVKKLKLNSFVQIACL